MNIVAEHNISGQPLVEQPHARPVRMVRWFIIVGLALALLVGGLVGFNAFRSHMIAQFFANNKPPPATVTVAEAKSEVIPNLLTAVGDLAEPFDISLPAVSRHLRVLERAYLIERRVDAQWRVCRLRPGSLRTAAHWIDRYRRLWEQRLDDLAAFLEEPPPKRRK